MKIDKTSTFIDVRTPEEFAEKHVDGAINIPVDRIRQEIGEITKLPKPIVVYCRSGGRSAMALATLKSAGVDAINGGGIEEVLRAVKL